MQTGRAWSEQDIRRFLEREALEYQRIELPHGLATPGSDRRGTADRIFGSSLEGKSVLDVGSFLGYFCLEALARGASRAVGWEVDPDRVRQARIIADIRRAAPEYHERDIEDAIPDEQFDIVICLNVLHHLANPIEGLDKLVNLTRERLILEVPSLGAHDTRMLGLLPGASLMLSRFPSVIVGRGRTWAPHTERKFYFTRSAIDNLLMYQRYHFARRQVIDSDKDRFLMIADRRRIDHLVVIAGPSFAGKSSVVHALQERRLPDLAARLGIESPETWPVAAPASMHTVTTPKLAGLIFEYDCLQPHLLASRTHDRDESLQVLEQAEAISLATVWSPPDALSGRVGAGLGGRSGSEARMSPRRFLRGLPGARALARAFSPPTFNRAEVVRRLYERPSQVIRHYRRWFDYCDRRLGQKVKAHLIVRADGSSLDILTRPEWDRLAREWETDPPE